MVLSHNELFLSFFHNEDIAVCPGLTSVQLEMRGKPVFRALFLFPDVNRFGVKYAEYLQQPQDHNDHNNDIQYLLDLRIHRNKPIDQPQADTDCDENEYQLN